MLRASGFNKIQFYPCRAPRDRFISVVRYGLQIMLEIMDRVRWLVTVGSTGPAVLTPNMYCVATLSEHEKSDENDLLDL